MVVGFFFFHVIPSTNLHTINVGNYSHLNTFPLICAHLQCPELAVERKALITECQRYPVDLAPDLER